MNATIKRTLIGITTTLACIGTAQAAEQCTNPTWTKIMERNTLTVGVKADYKPWGFRDSSGELIGMEIDLAKDVARRMGVELELVPVQSSNRMQFLEQGRIDLMIATMSDRDDRRAIVGTVQPNYYSAGTNAMVPKALGLTAWEELRGRPVCGLQGAFYNQGVEQRYGATIVAFSGNAEAKQALRDKKCVAYVFDDSSIMSDLASGGFDDFEMPFPSEDDTPWALAVPLAERDCVFGQFMSGVVFNWHQSGFIAEQEAKWGIQPTAFVAHERERFADPLVK